MYVFRHHDVTSHNEIVFNSQLLENLQKEIAAADRGEELPPSVAATGDEMSVTASLDSAQTFGHGRLFYPTLSLEAENQKPASREKIGHPTPNGKTRSTL